MSKGCGCNVVARNTPYHFRPGVRGIGIGAENMALIQPTTLPVDSIYAPRYNVQRSMYSYSGGALKLAQELPFVSVKGQGVYLSGEMAMQALVDFNNSMGG